MSLAQSIEHVVNNKKHALSQDSHGKGVEEGDEQADKENSPRELQHLSCFWVKLSRHFFATSSCV